MAALDDLHALNKALSQADRAGAKPSPDRVEVDGRSLAELLAFASQYGKLIKFYDLSDKADGGNWSIFFQQDKSVALALRASLDLASIRADFDRLIAAITNAASVEARIAHGGQALTLVHWLASIQILRDIDGNSLDEILVDLISSERRDLLAEPGQRLRLFLGGGSLDQVVRQRSDDWLELFVEVIDAVAGALLTVLHQDHAKTLMALGESLYDKRHAPQSGLYDAFAILFRHAQASINHFPERLIQFYQQSVIHQTARVGTPDIVCLTFTPAKGKTHVELPKGTAFLAGTDNEGEHIAYALDSAVSVDIASVAALNTLTVATATIHNDETPIPAQVLSGTVALSDKSPAIAEPFPIFGATKAGVSGKLTTVAASLGFAIASPTLLLTSGTRAVKIGFTLTDDCHAKSWALCARIQAAAGADSPELVFKQLIEAAFALRYSTAGGWVAVEGGYDATTITADSGYFELSFTLDSLADPFVALATTPPTKDAMPPGAMVPDRDVPVLLGALRQDPVAVNGAQADPLQTVVVYPYALLSGMTLSALSIDVDVDGLTQFETATPNGPVDTSQAFQIFGSPPVQGATLDITAPELFAKQMTKFGLTIDWFGLPINKEGFYSYYKAYVVDANGAKVPPGSQFDNTSFRASLQVCNVGWWDIISIDSPHFLFRTALNDPVPAPDQKLLSQSLLSAQVDPETPQDYYDPSLSKVRLTLVQPGTAFGNMLYASNVVAASVQLTAAASACAQQCGQKTGASDEQHLAPIVTANTEAADGNLDQTLKAAAQRTVANLDGAALQAIEDAIAASQAAPDAKAALRESLAAVLDELPGTWLSRLRTLWSTGRDFAQIHTKLVDWLAENSGAIPTSSPEPHARAHALVAAGSDILALLERAAGRPPPVARSMVSGGLRDVASRLSDVQATDPSHCIQQCLADANLLGFPNQPWLPTASSISISYSAAAKLPAPALAPPVVYYHLQPFDGFAAINWSSGVVPLLAPIDQSGALFITLSDPADALTLLVRLSPPAGGWSIITPPVTWAQATDANSWTDLTLLSDKTNNLQNSGIVSVNLADPETGALPVLRIGTTGDPEKFPFLAGLATNAATASWIGPGGGADLGRPLRAGTITKPASSLPDIGGVDQPLPSSGGAPALAGPAFDTWLAERMRHKDRAINGWDYANMVLAAFPSLWQVAVVPAGEGDVTRGPASVQVVAIPGPESPAIADPTIPSSDSTMLENIHDFLSTRISPFIELMVTNPVYRRIKVVAELIFTDKETIEANTERLNDELIRYLSPWPSAAIGPRPNDYYTHNEVAHFIRNRTYVRAILSLKLESETPGEPFGWHYLTSASSHDLKGKAQSGREPLLLGRTYVETSQA